MALTHVCVWDDKSGYRSIKIEEACRMYPYGVSANSEIFVCERCFQNVGLTAPSTKTIRHFRHTSKDLEKECEDRAKRYDRGTTWHINHLLPIKIEVKEGKFCFKLGFFYVDFLNENSLRGKKIIIKDSNQQIFEYSLDRINLQGITYLNIGNIPSKNYYLSYDGLSSDLNKYWPTEIIGINPEGTFFDLETGKMLFSGSKVYNNKDYYLLQNGVLGSVQKGIRFAKIAEMFTTWNLYKIHVDEFSHSSADFFRVRSLFLTKTPVKFYPVWPLCVQDKDILYHDENTVYFYMESQKDELHAYPNFVSTNYEKLDNGKLYKIYSETKAQILSVDKFDAIYLIKKDLNQPEKLPQVRIYNKDYVLIEESLLYKLPKEKQIIIQAQCDGKVVVIWNGRIKEILYISENQNVTVDNLAMGYTVQVFQGCDIVRTICFKKQPPKLDYNKLDKELVQKLQKYNENMVSVSHSIGAIANKLENYPLTKKWLYGMLRQGIISRDAYYVLKNVVRQKG